MKDAVGSTMLVYIVVIVVGIVGAILIASNMYTSAYKAKNNIISTIDRYYMINGNTDCFNSDEVCGESIRSALKNMGYHASTSCSDKIFNKVNEKANKDNEGNIVGYPYVDNNPVYNDNGVCIYKVNLSDNEYYFTVVTFSHLNINVLGIGSLFSTPVYGETRTYYNG